METKKEKHQCLNDINKYDVVSDFLSGFPNKKIVQTHKAALKRFFDTINKKPDAYIKDPRLLSNGKRIALLDGYTKDARKFWSSIQDLAPTSIMNYMSSLKVFFEHHNIQLETKVWREFKKRGKATTDWPKLSQSHLTTS